MKKNFKIILVVIFLFALFSGLLFVFSNYTNNDIFNNNSISNVNSSENISDNNNTNSSLNESNVTTNENSVKNTNKDSKIKSNPSKTTNKNKLLTKKEAYALATRYTTDKYHVSYKEARFVYNDKDFQYYEFPFYEKSTGYLESYVCVDIKTKHIWSLDAVKPPKEVIKENIELKFGFEDS